jgi:hypothetical protein
VVARPGDPELVDPRHQGVEALGELAVGHVGGEARDSRARSLMRRGGYRTNSRSRDAGSPIGPVELT